MDDPKPKKKKNICQKIHLNIGKEKKEVKKQLIKLKKQD